MSAPTAPARRAITPPKRPLPSWRLPVGLAAVVAITVWAGISIEFTLTPLITDIGRGEPVVRGFLDPNWLFIFRVWDAWLETIAIAIIASLVGNGIALVLAFLASPVTNPITPFQKTMKAVMAVVRSLPDVAYGLIFVAAVGVGSLAGILALIMFNIGVCAKLTAETIDAVDPGPIEAADASGASLARRARFAVLPQALPGYLSYSLYVFELNLRASVVLGFVGAGGIGSTIRVELSRFSYENLSAIIIALFVIVFALDAFSRWLRKKLI